MSDAAKDQLHIPLTLEEVLQNHNVPYTVSAKGIRVAIEATNEAIDRVEKNANPDWAEAAYLACCLVAEEQPLFTSDNVWIKLATLFPQHSTHEPRAMGAVLRRAAKEDKIRGTDDYVKSNRPECHNRPQMIWKSMIHEPDEY